MNEEINKLIQKADRSLKAAQMLCKAGDYDFSASRGYYAMFYVAEALLLSKGLAFSKHAAVIDGLYQHFIKPGIFPKQMHQSLHRAFQLRQKGDYMSSPNITKEDVESLLTASKEFIQTGLQILK